MDFNKNITQLLRKLENFFLKEITLSEILVKAGLILSMVIIIPQMFPSGRSFKYTDLIEGSIATKKVIAPFNFSVRKTAEELKAERAKASEEVPYFFSYNDTVNSKPQKRFEDFLIQIESLLNNNRFNASGHRSQIKDKTSVINDSVAISRVREKVQNILNIHLNKNDAALLLTKFYHTHPERLRRQLLEEFSALNKAYYINISKEEIRNKEAILIKNGIEETVPFSELIDPSEIYSYIDTKLKRSNFEDGLVFVKIIGSLLKPNLEFLESLTEERRREAVAAVPIGKDFVFENERIVDANERITAEIYQKLISLEIAIAESSEAQGDIQNLLSYLGKYLLTILILIIYALYLYANRKKIYSDNKKLLLITILILAQVGIGALIVNSLDWSVYVIPTTISSMLLGILFDPGVGLVGTVIIGLILAGIVGFDYSFIVLTIFVGIVAIYSVTRIRTRNQIFKAIIYIMTAYLIVVFTLGSLKYQGFQEIFEIFVFFLIPNAVLSPFITYMMLGIFERLFDITTDVTLLEFSDLNQPLLKELAVKAPGTFHHSIIVGNLAESAALSIGANSLLARVGSYYHDIGKMVKAEYFVENQKNKANKHEGLAPNMSALILTSHVKNGLELAEKNRLPKSIRDFIPEHHGTNLMSYFYNKALEENENEDINESDYRYPGPSPKSKETAIVMLADTVEAATRTLSNPSAGRLRKMVEELVEQRFLEGELDDSDLTMRDLKGIIDGFVSVLLGIYHQRIEYPKTEEKKKSSNQQSGRREKPNKTSENENSDS
jgi:putative nucleotidyltransferase with HDIG domain